LNPNLKAKSGFERNSALKKYSMEELGEVWEALYTCFNHPENYIAKGLEPID
jgi:hypothetical protein